MSRPDGRHQVFARIPSFDVIRQLGTVMAGGHRHRILPLLVVCQIPSDVRLVGMALREETVVYFSHMSADDNPWFAGQLGSRQWLAFEVDDSGPLQSVRSTGRHDDIDRLILIISRGDHAPAIIQGFDLYEFFKSFRDFPSERFPAQRWITGMAPDYRL